MCGIYGVLQLDGQPASPELLALLNLEIGARIFLDHRSPADVADERKAMAA